MSAFRHFLKTMKAEQMLSYLWVAEKSSESFLHFHLVGDCADTDTILYMWQTSCRRFGILTDNWSQKIEFVTDNGNFLQGWQESAKRISLYMSKGTEYPIDGKLFSMSNNFQQWKPQNIKRDVDKVSHLIDNQQPIYVNDYCAVYDHCGLLAGTPTM